MSGCPSLEVIKLEMADGWQKVFFAPAKLMVVALVSIRNRLFS